jgi:SM-20-related protein
VLQTINLRSHLDVLSERMWTLLPLQPDFCIQLQKIAKYRLSSNLFREAEISGPQRVEASIRNDKILWLDAKSLELTEEETHVLQKLEELRSELKSYFRIYLPETECHYAQYEKNHFYQKHVDITSHNNKRFFSFVIYLNDNWLETDGGELVAYKKDQVLFRVRPQMGQMILFRSELEHEVKITHRERLSLTGWFRQ